jgi:hypothetical protein
MRLLERVQWLHCRLHGHDWLVRFDKRRVYMRCQTCGRSTPGFETKARD